MQLLIEWKAVTTLRTGRERGRDKRYLGVNIGDERLLSQRETEVNHEEGLRLWGAMGARAVVALRRQEVAWTTRFGPKRAGKRTGGLDPRGS